MEQSIKDIILSEINWSTARSSGPGGQSVNKVESKVILEFNISDSNAFDEAQKSLLLANLSSILTKDLRIVVHTQEARSQQSNKDIALKKLYKMLENALRKAKRRKKTLPPKSAVEDRIKEKKKRSEVKAMRGNLANGNWQAPAAAKGN